MTVKVENLDIRDLWSQLQSDPISLYRKVSEDMRDAGIEEAPTISRVLEEVCPTQEGEKLDAYERLVREAGIRTQSNPAAGVWASTGEAFTRNAGTRMLFIEFFARNWRKVSFGMSTEQKRAILLSSDSIVGSWERPWAEAATARPDRRVEAAIPLSEIVGLTTPITGDAYRSWYMTYDAEQLRKFRVGESAEIPIATITGKENTVRLKKFGRGLRMSYEQLRVARVDKIAWYIQWAAVQAEMDKVAAALDVMVNGDGNANTAAAEHDITVLDGAAQAGELTLKGWLALKMKFPSPYMLTTALAREEEALKLALLDTGSGNIPLIAAGLGGLGVGLVPINRFADNTRYGWLGDAPDNKIVTFDNRFAIERVTEIGAEIAEMERYITRQVQELVMSEVEGYASLDPNAVKVLDLEG